MRNIIEMPKEVMICLGDESVIDMEFNKFREYCLTNLKDITIVPELLKKGLAERGSVTYLVSE